MRYLLILSIILLAGCTSPKKDPMINQEFVQETSIVGGEIDWDTNTFVDEQTGKKYSLADQVINEKTFEAYYPSAEEIKNKQPEVLRLEVDPEKMATIPEEYRNLPPLKLDGDVLSMLNKSYKYEVMKHCPGNNTIMELKHLNGTFTYYQFSDMKWKEIDKLPDNIKRLN